MLTFMKASSTVHRSLKRHKFLRQSIKHRWLFLTLHPDHLRHLIRDLNKVAARLQANQRAKKYKTNFIMIISRGDNKMKSWWRKKNEMNRNQQNLSYQIEQKKSLSVREVRAIAEPKNCHYINGIILLCSKKSTQLLNCRSSTCGKKCLKLLKTLIPHLDPTPCCLNLLFQDGKAAKCKDSKAF